LIFSLVLIKDFQSG